MNTDDKTQKMKVDVGVIGRKKNTFVKHRFNLEKELMNMPGVDSIKVAEPSENKKYTTRYLAVEGNFNPHDVYQIITSNGLGIVWSEIKNTCEIK